MKIFKNPEIIILVGALLIVLRLIFPVIGNTNVLGTCYWSLFHYNPFEAQCLVLEYNTFAQAIIIAIITATAYRLRKNRMD